VFFYLALCPGQRSGEIVAGGLDRFIHGDKKAAKIKRAWRRAARVVYESRASNRFSRESNSAPRTKT
jgi:hypothetical protein